MTEIEKAIKFFEEELKNGKFIEDCPQYNANEVALKVLQEKAEREKGCDFCNAKYAIMSGSRMSSELIHKGCVAKFCPNCGKRLVSEE